MTSIGTYLKKLIPDYVYENDSYKDQNNKGFIERYLEIFGVELDDELLSFIDDFEAQIINVETVDPKFLIYFEDLQGDIKNFGKTTEIRRNIIKYLTSIYRIKGTLGSIEAILATRGYKVNSITEEPIVEYFYDVGGVNYDDPDVKYDEYCPSCSNISIDMDKNYGGGVTTEELAIIDQLLNLVLPLDTHLDGLIINGTDVINLLTAIYLDEQFDVSSEPDPQGDLYYEEDDPLSQISMSIDVDGNLVVDGVSAVNYSVDAEGDLIFTT